MTKIKDVVKLMNHDGWLLIVLKGPHWQFVHPDKPGRLTISASLEHELGRGSLKSITKQAQLPLKEGQKHGALSGRH